MSVSTVRSLCLFVWRQVKKRNDLSQLSIWYSCCDNNYCRMSIPKYLICISLDSFWFCSGGKQGWVENWQGDPMHYSHFLLYKSNHPNSCKRRLPCLQYISRLVCVVTECLSVNNHANMYACWCFLRPTQQICQYICSRVSVIKLPCMKVFDVKCNKHLCSPLLCLTQDDFL